VTAVEIAGMVFDVYGVAEVAELMDLPVEKGAKPRDVGQEAGNAS